MRIVPLLRITVEVRLAVPARDGQPGSEAAMAWSLTADAAAAEPRVSDEGLQWLSPENVLDRAISHFFDEVPDGVARSFQARF
jgi:hypothetical protein